jgi:hypothetical protein
MTDPISNERRNRFTDHELEALARDDSTSSIKEAYLRAHPAALARYAQAFVQYRS